ncbi:hypothetical protein FDECE_13058 [Fusarium decemcellulare]|nr:hypothetical protein FDECE_13058 [Fusarium decemcellulare]
MCAQDSFGSFSSLQASLITLLTRMGNLCSSEQSVLPSETVVEPSLDQPTGPPSEDLLQCLKVAADSVPRDPKWIDYNLLRWMICLAKCDMDQNKCDATTRYAALSYVWGGEQKESQTLLANRDARQRPGSLSEEKTKLPQTVRHAMQLTERLGIGLLWVDSLCIAQDMEWEAKKSYLDAMGSIYRRAVVTLVASGIPNAYSGIRGLRNISRPRAKVKGNKKRQPKPAWYGRGWTFQELVCSRRRIFLEDKLVWECPHSAHWESSGTYDGARFANPSQIWSRDFSFSTANMSKFGDMVDNYTLRSLTFKSDILNACTGVLSLLSDSFHGGFIFAVPEMFFDIGLLWQPLHNDVGWNGPSQFPSWSWLGWNCPTDCNNYHRAFGRQRDSCDAYFELSDITDFAGFSPLCQWYRLHGGEWRMIESSSKPEKPENVDTIVLDARDFGAAMSTREDFASPKPEEESSLLYSHVPRGSFRIAKRDLPEALQQKLGVSDFPYDGSRYPHICIVDSRGEICGVLPRGVPNAIRLDEMYDFIAISEILIGSKKGQEPGPEPEARLSRYNVLLVHRNDGRVYQRIALGLILSTSWEQENTAPAYIQLG